MKTSCWRESATLPPRSLRCKTPIVWILSFRWLGKRTICLEATLRDRNDKVLERIYIDRRFKNDTERLEILFELHTKMTTRQASPKKPAQRKTNGVGK